MLLCHPANILEIVASSDIISSMDFTTAIAVLKSIDDIISLDASIPIEEEQSGGNIKPRAYTCRLLKGL